nr:AraC family transcriptional regulator [Raoultella sp. NCTC 9187]
MDGHAGLRGVVSRRPSPQGPGAGPAQRDKPLPSRIDRRGAAANARIYGTDSFIQALLERLCAGPRPGFPADYSPSLLSLLAAEITNAVELPLQLLLPTDRRARNVADQLLAHPDSPLTQTQLAQRWGLSVRSLSRLFREQTGLSFCQWRQQAKVVTSLQWVLAGEPIAEVAARSGYANVSAFIEVFRERFGRTPGQLQLASAKILPRRRLALARPGGIVPRKSRLTPRFSGGITPLTALTVTLH